MADISGNDFSSELKLLIQCSWRPPETLRATWVSQKTVVLDGDVNWEAFERLLLRHRVAALAMGGLGEANAIPPEAWERLQALARAARMQALRHAAETARVLRLFSAQGIEAIPLKGSPLSLHLFGDVALRHTHDVDLLVHEAAVDAAEALLLAEGYRRTTAALPHAPTPRQQAHVRSAHYHFEYERDLHGEPLLLELHWRRESWTPKAMDMLWKRSVPTTFLGAPARALDDNLQLLFLCDHGAHHRWFRLKWLSDVAMLFSRRDPESWDSLRKTAAELDLELPLAQAAVLVNGLYCVPLPPQASALIAAHPAAHRLAADAVDALKGDESGGMLPADTLARMRFLHSLRTRPDYRHRARHLLVNWGDFRELNLPDRLFWLYAIARPLIWLRRRLR